MRPSIILILSILIISGAYAITTFDEGTEIRHPPLNIATITIPAQTCVESGTITITGELTDGTYPSPRIDVGNDGTYEFRAIDTLQQTTWNDDWCGFNICEPLVTALNRRLSECNSQGLASCSIPLAVSNTADGGISIISDLELVTMDAYQGVLVGRGACDLDYVCIESDDSECVSGVPSETVLTNQYSRSMEDCDIYYPDYPYTKRVNCPDPYISAVEGIVVSSIEFAKMYFSLSPANTMGHVPYHTTPPPGQILPLTDSPEIILDYFMNRQIGRTNPVCFACGMYEAGQLFTPKPDVNQTIILFADSAANSCVGDHDMPWGTGGTMIRPNSNCQLGGGDIPGRELRAQEQAESLAQYLHTQYGYRVFTVGFGTNRNDVGLQAIADKGGGLYFTADTIDELLDLYKLLAELVSGECVRDCRYENPPFERGSYCGDGDTDAPNDNGQIELCDDGTDVNRETCTPDPGADCTVCIPDGTIDEDGTDISCTPRTFEDRTQDPPPSYCGDGSDPPDWPNSNGQFEQCDDGSDVNRESCVPDPGGRCTVCLPDGTIDEDGTDISCTSKTITSNLPDVRLCKIVESILPGYYPPVFLNDEVDVSLGTPDRFDLVWSINSYDPGVNPTLENNNVLRVEGPGSLVLDVIDGDGNADQACFTFTQTLGTYDIDPEPFTRLLISKTDIVRGYYEEPLTGRFIEWGPYEIIVQVWQT